MELDPSISPLAGNESKSKNSSVNNNHYVKVKKKQLNGEKHLLFPLHKLSGTITQAHTVF
jgi:hypothetical protein